VSKFILNLKSSASHPRGSISIPG